MEDWATVPVQKMRLSRRPTLTLQDETKIPAGGIRHGVAPDAEDGTFPGALLFTHHIRQAIESVATTDSVFVFMGATERLRQSLVLPMKR